MIYRLREGNAFTDVTQDMSSEDAAELNRDLRQDFRVDHMAWWEPQRERVYQLNRVRIKRGAVIDAFAHYDRTGAPVLLAWESNSHIRTFRVYMSQDGSRSDYTIDVHATTTADAQARAASVARAQSLPGHSTRAEKLKKGLPLPSEPLIRELPPPKAAKEGDQVGADA